MRKASIFLILIVLLGAVIVIASSVGAVSISFSELLTGNLTKSSQAILLSIRLPRVLLAVAVGAALAVSGAAMQGLFRNPLADPGLIGISSGAALAVAIMIVFAGPIAGIFGLYSLSIAAFIGGLITCLLIFKFAKLSGAFSVTYMLLAGIAMSAITGAATGFLTYLSDDQQLRAFTFWTMGSLGGAQWPALFVVLSVVTPAIVVLVKYAMQLNLLLLGEQEAHYLGINIKRLKYIIIMCTALSVGVSVAVSGIIGFVGLVIPHLVRLSLGPDHRVLIPASALLGALLLVVADTLARTIVAPAEMPVGVITSMIGGPFFLWLLFKQNMKKFGL